MTRTKKQIENYDFIMVFQEEVNFKFKDKLKIVQNALQKSNIKYKYFHVKSDKVWYLLIGFNDQNILTTNAEQLLILKKRQKNSFTWTLPLIQSELENKKDNRAYCRYLNYLKARQQNKQIKQQEQYSPFKNSKIDKFKSMLRGDEKLFNLDQETRCKYNELLNFKIVNDSQIEEYFFQQLIHSPYFIQLVPIQKPFQYKMQAKQWYFKSVSQYLGPSIQVYFELVRFMQRWLIFPAIVGLVTICLNNYYGFTADDSPADSVYAFFIMIWSIFFITKWQKHEEWLSIKANTGFKQSWAFHQKMVVKSNLTERYSPVTGQLEKYHTFVNKIYLYARSSLILLPIMLASIIFMVLSLNARGFIDSSHKLLYWEEISNWAKPGGIFDTETNSAQIVVLIHVLVTNLVDQQIYRPLAVWTTKLERHIQTNTYQNSIILKYFIYQVLITFSDLFYIAFIRFDIMGLKEQLVSLFFVDTVRRLVAETLIPWLVKKYKSSSYKSDLKKGKITVQQALQKQAIIEVSRPNYESFDDYLEIITNFGYLVMLSSCFPIAPVLIFFSHIIEVIHDKYKVLHIYKKSLPTKFTGVGFWKDLLVFICYFSIITNIMLFAFSSHQIVGFFPKIFDHGKDIVLGNTNLSTFFSEAVYNITDIVYDLDPVAENSEALSNLMAQSSSLDCQANPFNLFQNTGTQTPPMGMLQSFIPPAKEQESHFVIVLFIIEHIFIISFIFIRKILTSQQDLADIFIQRRNYRRGLKTKINKSQLAKIKVDKIN